MSGEEWLFLFAIGAAAAAILPIALTHGMHQAQEVSEAWRKLAGEKFDLLITDVNMPRMTGLALVKKLREEANNSIPVIMVTTKGAARDLANAPTEAKNHALRAAAEQLRANQESILAENALDVADMTAAGATAALVGVRAMGQGQLEQRGIFEGVAQRGSDFQVQLVLVAQGEKTHLTESSHKKALVQAAAHAQARLKRDTVAVQVISLVFIPLVR